MYNSISTRSYVIEFSLNFMTLRYYFARSYLPINMLPGDIVCVLRCSYFPVVHHKIGAHHAFREMLLRYGLMDGEMASMAEQNGIEAVPYDNSDGNDFKSLALYWRQALLTSAR